MSTSPAAGPRLRARVAELHRGGSSWLVAGSLISGVAAYGFQLLGSRVLGDEAFAPISVLWTIQYLVFSVILFGVETFLTRAITLHGDEHDYLRRAVLRLAAWGLVAAGAIGALTYALREALFAGAGELAVVAALIVVTYTAFMIVRGGLAGRRRFHGYGTVTALESLVRLAAAIPALALAGSTRALAWVMPVGAAVAALWWQPAHRRPAQVAEAPVALVPPTAPGRFLLYTTIANAAAQILLAAGPLVLVALQAAPGDVSVFFITVTAARVPIVLAYGGVLSRLLSPLSRLARRSDPRPLRMVAAATWLGSLVLAGLGAAAGAVLAPPLVTFAFGADFEPTATFGAATAAGVLLASGGLLLNQILVAASAEARLIAPWVAGLAAAATVIVGLDGDPISRVAAGFVAGEVVAITGLAAACLLGDTRAGHRPLPEA